MNIKILWTDPITNGHTIDKYQILIEALGTTNDFIENITLCDGTNSLTFGNKYCLVPMTSLRLESYLLPYTTMIRAKVLAHSN